MDLACAERAQLWHTHSMKVWVGAVCVRPWWVWERARSKDGSEHFLSLDRLEGKRDGGG